MASLSQHELLQQRLAEARAQIAEYENGYVLKRAYEKINEARAQIAEYKTALTNRTFKHGQEIERLAEARAQIAAKDAALRRAREALVCWNGYVQNVDDDIAVIDAALARETE